MGLSWDYPDALAIGEFLSEADINEAAYKRLNDYQTDIPAEQDWLEIFGELQGDNIIQATYDGEVHDIEGEMVATFSLEIEYSRDFGSIPDTVDGVEPSPVSENLKFRGRHELDQDLDDFLSKENSS